MMKTIKKSPIAEEILLFSSFCIIFTNGLLNGRGKVLDNPHSK